MSVEGPTSGDVLEEDEDEEAPTLLRKHTRAAERIQHQWRSHADADAGAVARARTGRAATGHLAMPMSAIEGLGLETPPSADESDEGAEFTLVASPIQRDASLAARRIQRRWRARALLVECVTRVQRQWRVMRARKGWNRLLVFGIAALQSSFPAVSRIQRCWRKLRTRRRYGGMVTAVNDRYLPNPFKTGKRKVNEWYTPAMNLRRERMWRSDRVQAALDRAWNAARSLARANGGKGAKDGKKVVDADGEATLGWAEYAEISRKIYLTLTRRTDPDEALASAQRDWDADTNGGGKDARIGRDAFCRSWFELADVNTHTMEEATYASFIEDLVERIVYTDPRTGKPILRADFEIMGLVSKNSGGQVESRVRWVIAFGRSATLRRGMPDKQPGESTADTLARMPTYGRGHEATSAAGRPGLSEDATDAPQSATDAFRRSARGLSLSLRSAQPRGGARAQPRGKLPPLQCSPPENSPGATGFSSGACEGDAASTSPQPNAVSSALRAAPGSELDSPSAATPTSSYAATPTAAVPENKPLGVQSGAGVRRNPPSRSSSIKPGSRAADAAAQLAAGASGSVVTATGGVLGAPSGASGALAADAPASRASDGGARPPSLGSSHPPATTARAEAPRAARLSASALSPMGALSHASAMASPFKDGAVASPGGAEGAPNRWPNALGAPLASAADAGLGALAGARGVTAGPKPDSWRGELPATSAAMAAASLRRPVLVRTSGADRALGERNRRASQPVSASERRSSQQSGAIMAALERKPLHFDASRRGSMPVGSVAALAACARPGTSCLGSVAAASSAASAVRARAEQGGANARSWERGGTALYGHSRAPSEPLTLSVKRMT